MKATDAEREERGRRLLARARGALEETLLELSGIDERRGSDLAADAAWLAEPGACFVTLRKAGELRGCIGSVQPARPLREDLRANAVAAALRDPRFPPVTAAELPAIQIEVSLLSPTEEIPFCSEEAAVAALRPHVDGVILEFDGQRGTFLPQVWESLTEPETFLRQLKLKAGLDPDFWSIGIRLWRYTVEHWEESEARARSSLT